MAYFALRCWLSIAGLLIASDLSAQSIGYWHLPSTLPQFCGLGVGPGHHAPMIRSHHCDPMRVTRRVHVNGCVSEGLPQCEFFYAGGCGVTSSGCQAQLDSLMSNELLPESAQPTIPPSQVTEPETSILPTPEGEKLPPPK